MNVGFARSRRRLIWATIIIGMLLVGLIATVGHPVRAASMSPGCEYVNDPVHDKKYAGTVLALRYFYAGDQIIASAGPPTSGGNPTVVNMWVNDVLVDTDTFPGTVEYVVPADAILGFKWGAYLAYANATWSVECVPTPFHSSKEKSVHHTIPYTGIKLLSEAEQAPYLSIPNAAGATPCGVFDVNGWGAKYVGMGDFPGCTAPVTVMCLNGDGEWTADTVSDVVMHGDWEVDFISSQDGTCGLFEQ